jgi:DNA-binding MarR family transcriptional regulator
MPKTIDNVNHPSKAPSDSALELIHAVMHLYRSRQFQALREGPLAVTHMDAKVLGFFARHPGATQSELALHSGRDKAQLARLVAGLRERGLLAAAQDDSDRRVVRVSLTKDGQAAQRALQQQARRLEANALAKFSSAERTQLVALLQRLQANLESDA